MSLRLQHLPPPLVLLREFGGYVGRLLVADLPRHLLPAPARVRVPGFPLAHLQRQLDLSLELANPRLSVGSLVLHVVQESIDGLGHVVAVQLFLEVVDGFTEGVTELLEHLQDG